MHISIVRRKQQGAALVIGMILLLVLTLLAVSGMNTASTELIMAGNEQYQENSFQAAEIGIEQAMKNAQFETAIASEAYPLGGVRTQVPGGHTGDTFRTTITPRPAPNKSGGAMWGASVDAFASYHFEIRSEGAVANGRAASEHVQGMFVASPADSTPPPLPGNLGLNPP